MQQIHKENNQIHKEMTETLRSSRPDVLCKKVFLEISQNSQKNTCAQACNFIKKETLAQVFSCEFCQISKDTFSYRTPLVAAS